MNILSIGGSDPSSGAGIQNDIKTSSLLEAYCFTVITVITSQNTSKYTTSSSVSPKLIKQQVESVISDFDIDIIKIGMVYDSKTIAILHSILKSISIPIIVDPVIKSTTNGVLLKKDAIANYRKKIIPLAHTITPNLIESEVLSGIKFQKKIDVERIASKIIKMGAKNVVITGIESEDKIVDYVKSKSIKKNIVGKKIKRENHGSGCTYSTALAISIAEGKNILKAAKFAKEFTIKSIVGAKKIGKGIRITNQKSQDKIKEELSTGISEFVQIENIHKAIPECQTNLVFSKTNPKSTKDILGLLGRIVKSGENVIVAGELEYGGSKHVATAVLIVNKKFPKIRSGVNIKYDSKVLEKLKRKKMQILNYDREQEPTKIKNVENSSIQWGIKSAITKSNTAPDVIYHKGDMGKEPMILIFGTTPQNIMKKISGIF